MTKVAKARWEGVEGSNSRIHHAKYFLWVVFSPIMYNCQPRCSESRGPRHMSVPWLELDNGQNEAAVQRPKEGKGGNKGGGGDKGEAATSGEAARERGRARGKKCSGKK